MANALAVLAMDERWKQRLRRKQVIAALSGTIVFEVLTWTLYLVGGLPKADLVVPATLSVIFAALAVGFCAYGTYNIRRASIRLFDEALFLSVGDLPLVVQMFPDTMFMLDVSADGESWLLTAESERRRLLKIPIAAYPELRSFLVDLGLLESPNTHQSAAASAG